MLIMTRDLKTVFEDSKMIAVAQNNASNAQEIMVLKHRLYKHGITVKFFPNQVMLQFIHSKTENDLEFMQSSLTSSSSL